MSERESENQGESRAGRERTGDQQPHRHAGARGGSRRTLLKKGLAGGAILLVGGSIPILLRSGSGVPAPGRQLLILTPAEYAVFAAAAARICDPGVGAASGAGRFPTAQEVDCAAKLDVVLAGLHPKAAAEFRQLLNVFENAMTGLFSTGSATTFTRSTAQNQDRRLEAWRHSRVALFRSGYQAMKRLAHATYYASPETYARVGYPGPPVVPQVPS